MQEAGKLYIVATPIGNLEDITIRAITVLKNVKLIAAEDTRQSRKLLQHYGINVPMYSLHAHNEKSHSAKIIQHLKEGEDVAYITDAGTPLISDPGAVLVGLVREQGFTILPVPGPSAAIAALSVSGFTDPHFYFEGFLPNKTSSRKNRLLKLKKLDCTLVFYESPHRIMDMLSDLLEVMGDREMIIAREITKKFETILSGKVQELSTILTDSPLQRRGEFVILLAGNGQDEKKSEERMVATLEILMSELPIKRAVITASELLGVGKNELYPLALKIKNR